MQDARILSAVTSEEPNSHTKGDSSVDHERLRYVTKLLGSQEGLSTALFGTLLFFVNAGEILRWLSGWSTLFASLAFLSLLFGGMRIYIVAQERWIPEYYQRRFGSVQASRWRGSKWKALFGLAVLLTFTLLLFFGRPIAHYFEPVTSHLHLAISDPACQINLWPSFLWLALFFRSLRWHMSSLERQRASFLLVVTIGLASIVCYAIWHPDARQFGLWKLLNAGGFGLSFIALGLYDHIILIRALPKRLAEGDDE